LRGYTRRKHGHRDCHESERCVPHRRANAHPLFAVSVPHIPRFWNRQDAFSTRPGLRHRCRPAGTKWKRDTVRCPFFFFFYSISSEYQMESINRPKFFERIVVEALCYVASLLSIFASPLDNFSTFGVSSPNCKKQAVRRSIASPYIRRMVRSHSPIKAAVSGIV